MTLVPELGGKIASIAVNGTELLQPPLKVPARRTHTMGFAESDASGWDECLPSVAACTVTTVAGEAHIPDHGDLWRVEWERQGIGNREQGIGNREQAIGNGRPVDGPVTLRGRCFSLPLELERSVAVAETGSGWRMDLTYQLTNTGDAPVPWSWAAHPLFLAEAGDRIVLPDSIQSLRVEGSGRGRLGKSGDLVDWPVAKLAGGGTTDLSVALAPESGVGDKLFAGPLTAAGSWCVLERPSAGVRIKVSFDPEATPYLGLWICYGGWPEGEGPKQTCVAMEPATAPVDSLAVSGPWSRELGPGARSIWTMGVEIEMTQVGALCTMRKS